jgi:hypothetical protein
MSSYHQQRETRSRVIFTVLIIAVTVGITYGLIRLTLPSLTGQTTTTTNDSTSQTAEKQEEEKDLPRGDAKRVADLDRLAAALKTYKEQHGGYPISTGTCAGGSFDSDADLGFLADLEREAVIDAIPRDPAGVAKITKAGQDNEATSTEDCDTMYGAKHYLYYSNGTKFALIASVDDADAIPDDAAGVYLAEGDREWFDGSALIADWHWSRNVYIVSNQKLAEVTKK